MVSMLLCTIGCLRCFSGWCLFDFEDLWNAVVCSQPPSLLIDKVWVPVMHFCAYPIHCNVHWRVGRRLGSCRLISVQSLIGSTIRELSIYRLCYVSIGGSVLSIQTQFLSNRPQHIMVDGCRSKLVGVVSGEPQLGTVLCRTVLYTSGPFLHSGK